METDYPSTGYVKEFPEFPPEIIDAWGWIWAFHAWDHGEPEKLKNLILSEDPMPSALKPALAKRISGEKKPNKKRSAKLSHSVDDRMIIGLKVSTHLWFSKANETWGMVDEGDDRQRYIDAVATAQLREPIEIKNSMRAYRREINKSVAKRFDISVETLENILREIRDLAKRYPDV